MFVKIGWDNAFMLQDLLFRLPLFDIVSFLSHEPHCFEIYSPHKSMEVSEYDEFKYGIKTEILRLNVLHFQSQAIFSQAI